MIRSRIRILEHFSSFLAIHHCRIGNLSYSHQSSFTKMTDADKRMNPLHFGSDPVDIRIRFRIPDRFWLRFWPWRRFRCLSSPIKFAEVTVVTDRSGGCFSCRRRLIPVRRRDEQNPRVVGGRRSRRRETRAHTHAGCDKSACIAAVIHQLRTLDVPSAPRT